MLDKTFLHLPGFGRSSEDDLWKRGIRTWTQLLNFQERDTLFASRPGALKTLQLSLENTNNPHFFSNRIPVSEHWRLYGAFRNETGYLDIETNGLGRENFITTVAVFDGKRVHTFVRGKNMDALGEHLDDYRVLVTFNGSGFDLPFLRRELGLELNHVHLDLMHIYRSLEIRGGLKKIEERFGLNRGGLSGVDGFCAILFWKEYERTGDPAALETLLSYNAEDVIHLESLMVRAYNMKAAILAAGAEPLPMPGDVENPHRAHPGLVQKIVTERNHFKAMKEAEKGQRSFQFPGNSSD